MRHLALMTATAGLVVAPPLAAAPFHGSGLYQRTVSCAGLAMVAMAIAVEYEGSSKPLEANGWRVRFGKPEVYERLADIWMRAAIRMGEYPEQTVRQDVANEMNDAANRIERSVTQIRETVEVMRDFEGCKSNPPPP